jgi:hypothetical protein
MLEELAEVSEEVMVVALEEAFLEGVLVEDMAVV